MLALARHMMVLGDRRPGASRGRARAAADNQPILLVEPPVARQPPHCFSIICLSAGVTGSLYFRDTWANRTL